MKSICYIVPYFGILPYNFQIWLDSCKYNNTIDWIVFTNDTSEFNYPPNVKRIVMTFEELKDKIQSKYDFKINIDTYWRLSLFKPTYGEIFKEYICNYDFWGHCDVDLIWGNIRKFLTEDILEKYEKIGFQGHSTLYRNLALVNERYKTIVPGKLNYKEIFSGNERYSFDENGMEDIYNFLNIPYYKVTNFAHLSKYDYNFFLKYLPKEDDYKNNRQIFEWENGKLNRLYLYNNKIYKDEFMYLHFFCRPISFYVKQLEKNKKYVIYPDKFLESKCEIDEKFIKRHGKCSKIKYYVTSLYYNRKKITLRKIFENLDRMIKYKKQKRGC